MPWISTYDESLNSSFTALPSWLPRSQSHWCLEPTERPPLLLPTYVWFLYENHLTKHSSGEGGSIATIFHRRLLKYTGLEAMLIRYQVTRLKAILIKLGQEMPSRIGSATFFLLQTFSPIARMELRKPLFTSIDDALQE